MFVEQTFNIPPLKGISAKNIEEHLKLYAGYVKHANLIAEHIAELTPVPEQSSLRGAAQTNADLPAAPSGSAAQAGKYTYAINELRRRFSFEFNGMRNHEVYFRAFEGGAKPSAAADALRSAIEKQWSTFEAWLAEFKALALTRGIGWAMLFYDPVSKQLLNAWVDEQHLGQLQNCPLILGLDMWEHAFVADYQPSGKKNYIEDFFVNLNWGVIEKNFAAV